MSYDDFSKIYEEYEEKDRHCQNMHRRDTKHTRAERMKEKTETLRRRKQHNMEEDIQY